MCRVNSGAKLSTFPYALGVLSVRVDVGNAPESGRNGACGSLVFVIITILGSGFVCSSGQKSELNHQSDDGQSNPCARPDDCGLVEEVGARAGAGGEQGSGRGHADRRAEERGDECGGASGHDDADEESEGQACESGAEGDELVACGASIEVGFDGVVEVFDELL